MFVPFASFGLLMGPLDRLSPIRSSLASHPLDRLSPLTPSNHFFSCVKKMIILQRVWCRIFLQNQTPKHQTPKTMTRGFVYCLSNPSYKGTYKIGLTTKSIDGRMKQLYKTGVIHPFVCEFAKRVKQVHHTERLLHKRMASSRVHPDREFFKISLESIKKHFQQIDGCWINPSSKTSTDSQANTTTKTTPTSTRSWTLKRRQLQRKAHRKNPFFKKRLT